ncbi:MAG: sodium:proton antiporter [Thermogemmatispora sp.]|uniref:cation:proton antiporter n=1 Tax=Thermogemmatispora sp. TaxID=1968838 RepID=UPI0019F59A8F|nr:sodium:proton antiporter [Thermogemmatispora sp.]MBE3564455.1 sodium:proton antiporter [Thermogemmatispora sp.]
MPIPLVESYLILFLLIALATILITRWIAVPYTLGLVIIGLLLSALHLLPPLQLDPELVLFVFLPALLFEGAWSLNWQLLKNEWRSIFFLAGPGLLLSLCLIAALLHWLEGLDWGAAFLLAAILSPTDPVAVLSLFRQLHLDERLSVIIEGESLFNDGVAGALYQVFLAAVLLASSGESSLPAAGLPLPLMGLLLFLLEGGGAIVLGLVGGWLLCQLLRHIDDALSEIGLTILAAYGLYLLADRLHLSAIITVIVAGLLLGNYGRRIGMSVTTRTAVDTFWSVVAFIANALLFLLIGVQLNPLALPPLPGGTLASLLNAAFAIGVVLLARLLLVLLLAARSWLTIAGRKGMLPFAWQLVIFWGGLRGALSLALALALPLTLPQRPLILASTGAVVLFTLLVQGLSMRWLLLGLPSLRDHQAHTDPDIDAEQRPPAAPDRSGTEQAAEDL